MTTRARASGVVAMEPRWIVSERLVLKPLAPRDYRDIAAIAGARDIADTTISVPHPMTLAIARDWVEDECESMRRGAALVLTVCETLAPSLLGVVSLRHIDHEHECAELSFWFDASARGRGFATEAAGALVQLGFRDLGLHRVEAYHMARNPASERVLSRLGFQCEGRLRQRVLKWGRREDAKLWSKLRDDPDPGAPAGAARDR